MNGDGITELGQVREQENMLERAQAQAARMARRDLGQPSGSWLVGLGGWRRPFVARRGLRHHAVPPCARPTATHSSV